MDTNVLERDRFREHGSRIHCEFILDEYDEEIGVWAKGHHNAPEFCMVAREFALAEAAQDFGAEIAIAGVNHAFWTHVPSQDGADRGLVLIPCTVDTPGAYPVTFVKWDE